MIYVLLSLCPSWNREASGHKVCMQLRLSVAGGEKTLQVLVLGRLPPLVPVLLLCQNFRGERGCTCIPDGAALIWWGIAEMFSIGRSCFILQDYFCCNAICCRILLPLFTCTRGLLQRMSKSLCFQPYNAALQAILFLARDR